MRLPSFFNQWKVLSRFNAVDPDARSIVFYAEDAASWRYFETIIDELLDTHNKQICYVTSSPHDPVLQKEDSRIKTFCIGSGFMRTMWFQYLQAGTMVMTMPDIETYHIKRSKHPVHYVYVYHSMVSSHMVYRRGAFDYFDSILCVGPHHKEEILATEQLYGLTPKRLVESGYGLLDSILSTTTETDQDPLKYDGLGKRVLIAPSWGEHGLIETLGAKLVEVLLQAGHQVTVRPHSMTIRRYPKQLKELGERFSGNASFNLDIALTSQGTVQASDIMISDWSGAALEYAFGLERPVIFVDIPRKVNNPEYEKIPCVPIEVKLRSELGEVVSPENLSDVPGLVDKLCQNPDLWKDMIRELRNRWIYNVGASGKVAADYIAQVASKTKSPTGEV